MADGSFKPAKDVAVGDPVLVVDHTSGNIVRPGVIGEVLNMGIKPCFELTFDDGRKAICSDTHRVFIDGDYKRVLDMNVGEKVLDQNHTFRTLVSRERMEPREVITFSIADETAHNYFADGVLAHNLKPNDCVLPGTLITMADGTTKAVELVEAGDMVSSYDTKTNTFESSKVLSRFATRNPNLVTVSFSNGSKFVCSPTHVMFTDKGWINASGLLNSRNKVKALSIDGSWVDILHIEATPYPADTFVYLVEVEKNHNLFVDGILCHNIVKVPYT
jgi:hypothetical protein